MVAPVGPQAIADWRANPCKFVFDQFGVTPDAWQADALNAFADPKQQRIALQACAGPGKSAALAWMGWNFLSCYAEKGEHPNGAAFSITADNLKKNLWKELAKWRDRSPMLQAMFDMTNDRIFARAFPKTWFIDAYSWPKTANAEEAGRTLSGLPSKFILYLADEIGDIPPAVGRAAEQGLFNCAWGKIVGAGNPTSHTGMLYHVVKEQPDRWTIIRITGDPDDPKRSSRINIEEARAQIKAHGRDNPWVMAYILGLFPPTSVNALFGPDEIAECMKRHIPPNEYEFSQTRIGIDVARFGDDRTVMWARQGLHAARKPVELRNARTEDIAGRLMVAKQRINSELELIDDTGGWSGGVQDACRLAGVNLYPVNFSGKADDPRYFNKRSEMFFRMSEWVNKQGGALANVPELSRELCAHTYYFDNGKMRVVEKDQVKTLLNGHSPDYADALALTFALVDMPSNVTPEGILVGGVNDQRNHTKDWDIHRDV